MNREESIQQDENELSKILAGNGGKIYPVPRDNNWSGLEYGALFKPLIGTFEQPKIVIAVAHDMPDNLVYIPYSQEFGVDGLNAIYDEAQINLEAIQVTYKVKKHRSHCEVDASGHEFSSEFLLHNPFIQELHTILKSDEIAVAVPRRGYFKAIALSTSKDLYNAFIDDYEAAYDSEEIEKPPITKGVFVIRNGKIVQRGELEKY